MSKTKTPTAVTHAPFSPAWWEGAHLALAEVQKASLRPASPATVAADRIVSAVNAAGKLPQQPGTVPPWKAAQPQRLWDKTCNTLRELITREDHRTRSLRDHHVALLATLPMHFLQVAAQLYAEVAPALLANAAGDDCPALRIRLDLKLQELVLNYTLTPEAIDAHQTLTREAAELGPGQACEVCVANPVINLAQKVAVFAQGLCLMVQCYAPDSNTYAALVGDEFKADNRRMQKLARRQ